MALLLWLGLSCAPAVTHGPGREPGSAAAVAPKRLPVRMRRLSNAEYRNTLEALLGIDVVLPPSFPEDVRVEGFSANTLQGVDATYLGEAQAFARTLAAQVVRERLRQIVVCDLAVPDCPRRWLSAWGARAYRRALRANELESMLLLFEQGKAHGGVGAGLELVLASVLVAPQLLYVSELGEATAASSIELTSEEAASVLSYMLLGGPPDASLQQAGSSGRLAEPEERESQALRLLGKSEARFQFRRFVREWLGLDPLEELSKPVPDDSKLRLGLLAETDAFVDEVFMYEGASLDRLLLANFTVIPASLSEFEGLAPGALPGDYGRASLEGSGRLGLLQQPSFLAVHSHEAETAPVLRGKAILERFLCVDLPRPAELGLVVNFPLPDPGATTRERHQRHMDDVTCRSCHRTIDALGYTFENFDFVGRRRERENGKPVDTRVDYDGPGGPRRFEDSRDVSRWLAHLPRAHDCFARQAFRFFSGQTDAGVEAAFLDVRASLPEADRQNLFRSLVAFVKSPLFMERQRAEVRP